MKRLETERLVIRKFEAKDAPAAHVLFTDAEAMRWLALYPPLTSLDETEERVNEWIHDGEHFAIEKKETGEFIGYIAINPDSEEEREDTRELGFGVVTNERRKGYMLEAIRAVLDVLNTDEAVVYVWACCFEGNDASKSLIEKVGFKLQNIGTFEVDNDREYVSYEYRMTLK